MCSDFDIPIVHSKRWNIRKIFYDEMNIDTETNFNQFKNSKINFFPRYNKLINF